MSSQDRPVPHILAVTGFSEDYVRQVIHDFDDHGMDALDPKWSGGRPPTFTEAIRRKIRNLASTRPKDLGLPFTCWSLSKLAE